MAKTYSIDEIESMLSNGIYKVRFVSAQDASIRTMCCTRDFDWLRSEGIADEMGWKEPKGGDTNNLAIKVWDVDAKGWRSFYANLVEYIEFYSPTKDEDIIEEVED